MRARSLVLLLIAVSLVALAVLLMSCAVVIGSGTAKVERHGPGPTFDAEVFKQRGAGACGQAHTGN